MGIASDDQSESLESDAGDFEERMGLLGGIMAASINKALSDTVPAGSIVLPNDLTLEVGHWCGLVEP